jgi:spermidine synthase
MRALAFLAVLVSGTAALVAEVAWFRGLGRGVGTSAEALAVVTAAFLGGLGLGAAVGGRVAARSERPFRGAALCETVAGLLVFASPWAVSAVPSLHLGVLQALSLEPGPSAWPAALVGVPVLLLPCAFLGATLPFLVRGIVAARGGAGRTTGRLYAVNTLGAAAGVVLAVFVLLPGIGETATLRVAAAGNLLAAAAILLAERPATRRDAAPQAGEPSALPERAGRAAGFALFGSGAFALGAEVAWFRLLEPLTDVSSIGLAFLLVPVLFGTAVGGALGGSLAERVRRPDLAVATAIGVGGLLTLLSLPGTGQVPYLALRYAGDRGDLLPWKLAGSALCMVPALVAFAAAYPLAVRARARLAPEAARASGTVYAWNAAGNVVGSLFAGFWLLPNAGSPRTVLLLGALALAFAAALRLDAPRPRRAVAALVFLVPVAVLAWPGTVARLERGGPSLPEVVALSKWRPDRGRVRSHADLEAYAELLGGVHPRPAVAPLEDPILPVEGRVGTVALLDETNGQVRLRQGGLSESVLRRDDPDAGSATEVALALLPWLLHPDPRRALVIGHGAGWTVETLLDTGVPHVDVAELEPAVLDVVARWRGPLLVHRAPNARLHVADGRLFLRRAADAGGAYDLVVSQPSHPWVPGAGHLFTADAYRLARRALRPGGVFAQWLNVFDMDVPLFATALAGWREAFPRSWLFFFRDEVVLVGFTGAPRVDGPRWERAFAEEAGVGRRARDAGLSSPSSVLRRFVADASGVERLVPPGTRPATDDDPRLELGLARARLLRGADEDDPSALVEEALRGVFPPDLAAAIPDAEVRRRWVTGVLEEALDDHALREAEAWSAVQIPMDARAMRARARLARERADPEAALSFLRAAAAREDPDEAEQRALARADLLNVLVDAGRPADAAREAEAFAALHPDHGPILEAWAKALVLSGDRAAAEPVFARAVDARSPRPPHGTGHEHARLLLTLDAPDLPKARASLLADPGTFRSIEAMEELARLDAETGEGGRPAPGADDHLAILEGLRRERGERQLAYARRDFTADPRRALREATAAAEMLPDEPEPWRLRGWLELHLGLPDRAVVSLRRAVAAAGDDGERERRRALAYLRMFSADPGPLAAPLRPEEP